MFFIVAPARSYSVHIITYDESMTSASCYFILSMSRKIYNTTIYFIIYQVVYRRVEITCWDRHDTCKAAANELSINHRVRVGAAGQNDDLWNVPHIWLKVISKLRVDFLHQMIYLDLLYTGNYKQVIIGGRKSGCKVNHRWHVKKWRGEGLTPEGRPNASRQPPRPDALCALTGSHKMLILLLLLLFGGLALVVGEAKRLFFFLGWFTQRILESHRVSCCNKNDIIASSISHRELYIRSKVLRID